MLYMLILVSIVLLMIGVVGYEYFIYKLTIAITQPYLKPRDEIKNVLKDRYHVDVQSLPLEYVVLKSDVSGDIETIVIENNRHVSKVIILVHGIGRDAFAMLMFERLYRDLGFHVISYSQRNHGESTKSYTTFGYYEKYDLNTVVNYAYTRFGRDIVCGLHGVSLGAAVAIQYSGSELCQNKIDFVVSDCAFSDINKQIDYLFKKEHAHLRYLPVLTHIQHWIKHLYHIDVNQASPKNYVSNIDVPVLYIHGNRDSYIKIEHTYELYDATNSQKALFEVENAEHANSMYVSPQAYQQEIVRFLDTHLHFY